VLLSAANNVARFDHNPVTGESLGLLIEEQRTNLVTYSEQIDDAAWTKTQSSVTANAVVAPDGTLTGDKLVEDTANSTHTIDQILSFTSGISYTVSVYVKAAERPTVQLVLLGTAFNESRTWFNLATGVATTTIGAVTSAFVINVGNGWYRVGVTQSAIATSTASTSFRIWTGSTALYTGDGYSGLYIWGAQVEAGVFPTSYIPTVASQVTRSNDVAVMTGENFSSWYVQNDGTFFADFIPRASIVSPERGVFCVLSGFARGHYFHLTTQLSARTRDASGVYTAGSTSFTPGTQIKMAGVLSNTLRNYSVNGASVISNTSAASVPDNTQLQIGFQQIQGSLPQQLNGTIRKLAYYPKRLANDQLQGMTTV
jgi:hypothetical protein